MCVRWSRAYTYEYKFVRRVFSAVLPIVRTTIKNKSGGRFVLVVAPIVTQQAELQRHQRWMRRARRKEGRMFTVKINDESIRWDTYAKSEALRRLCAASPYLLVCALFLLLESTVYEKPTFLLHTSYTLQQIPIAIYIRPYELYLPTRCVYFEKKAFFDGEWRSGVLSEAYCLYVRCKSSRVFGRIYKMLYVGRSMGDLEIAARAALT